jgi:hypothetical protein
LGARQRKAGRAGHAYRALSQSRFVRQLGGITVRLNHFTTQATYAPYVISKIVFALRIIGAGVLLRFACKKLRRKKK